MKVFKVGDIVANKLFIFEVLSPSSSNNHFFTGKCIKATGSVIKKGTILTSVLKHTYSIINSNLPNHPNTNIFK